MGAFGGLLVIGTTVALDKIGYATKYVQIDDPIGAFAVHGVCGMCR